MNTMAPFLTIRGILFFLFIAFATAAGTAQSERLRGTLVVAVPVNDGLVACADKRLFNVDAGTYRDETVKIRRVGENALFAATSTVGFYDRSKKQVVFDAFEVTAAYSAKHDITDAASFFDGLRNEISLQLRSYLAGRPYADWPETDKANQGLLFNLVFYTLDGDVVHSHTLKVFYEKAPSPIITIPPKFTEVVKSPKLSGKGRDVMGYLARNPAVATEPSILKFDESKFDLRAITVRDAVDFSRKLFIITNTALPQARVSATFDCAYVSHQLGFQWLDGFGRPAGPYLQTAGIAAPLN
jgi:hypothetical protein